MKSGGKPDDNSTRNPSGATPQIFNPVMVASKGAIDAFSGASRHVNQSLRTLVPKNNEAVVARGIGFGHGFGIGLGGKPGFVYQVQSSVAKAMTKMMLKFGMVPKISNVQTFASKDPRFSTQTEQIINRFLQTTVLKDEEKPPNEQLQEYADRLRSENNMLQLVLKHHQVIEELVEENKKIHRILVEQLKIPPGKLN